jgi:hypothetical protein
MSIKATISGGVRLKSALNKLAKQQAPQLKVGVLEGATDSEGQAIAPRAFYNEFGTKYIPPRPAFRLTIKARQENWKNGVIRVMKGKTREPGIFMKAYRLLGEVVKADLIQKIGSGVEPALSPITEKRKAKLGKKMPALTLVEDGDYQKSIDYVLLEE